MKVLLVKGKFKLEQIGKGAVRITCNVCGKIEEGISSSEDEEIYRKKIMSAKLPGAPELSGAQGLLQQASGGVHKKLFKPGGSGARSLDAVNQQLSSSSPNAMEPMLVAPMILNGRPMGLQPIMCFYCRQVGLVNFESERGSPNRYGLAVTSLNDDPRVHARMRAEVSYTVLLCLDYMCCQGIIPPSADIVCPGASIQCSGKSGGGKQDAHQVLREVTINGHAIYDVADQHVGLGPGKVPKVMRDTLVYCHATISHLDAIYNEVDGLIEHEIAVDFIELAQQIVSGRLRKVSKYDNVTRRYLWRLLLIRYFYACRIALIQLADEEAKKNVLNLYLVEVDGMKNGAIPDYVDNLDAIQMCGKFTSLYSQV
jgi:hypothetical protein